MEYVCNSGFTRASAPAPLADEQTAAMPARIEQAQGFNTASSMVILGVLSQIDRLLACSHQQADAELKWLQSPEHAQCTPEEPVFSLTPGEDSRSGGGGDGQSAEDAQAYVDALADKEDDDEFVFESLDEDDDAKKGFLASLLPTDSDLILPCVRASSDTAGGGGWESGGECVRKLAAMAKIVTYARVVHEWTRLNVSGILFRIVRRLLQLPPTMWQQDGPAEEDQVCEPARVGLFVGLLS